MDVLKVTVPQGTIHYREAGSGEPVVFVHGFLMNGRLWDPLVARLSDRFRCIAPDWPMGSHPEAMRPDADLSPRGMAQVIADTLAALDLNGVTLVGNDSGGAISQIVAAHQSQRLARLVLTNCDTFEDFPPRAFRGLVHLAKVPGALTALMAPTGLAFIRRSPLAYGLLSAKPMPDEILHAWTAAFHADRGVRRDGAKFAAGMDPAATLDAAARLAQFDRPALLTWGARDPFFKLTSAERLAKVLPQARLERIDDARTFVMWDQPDRVAGAIREFVEATTADQRDAIAAAAGEQ